MVYDVSACRSSLGAGPLRIPPDKIREWVVTHFPNYKSRKQGQELCINNPFNGDTGFNLNISPSKGGVYDWRGDAWIGVDPKTGMRRKRSFIKFVQLYLNCTYRAAILSVLGTSVDAMAFLRPSGLPERPEPSEIPPVALPMGSEPLASASNQLAVVLQRWLSTRGYTMEDIARHRLHYLGTDVIWPYYEYDELVYWQSRSRLSKRFTFPSADVGSTKEFLYGFDDVEPMTYMFITEAIIDAHTIHDQSVAAGGAELSSKQIAKIDLLRPMEGIILGPDNDVAGIQSIIHNGRILLSKGYRVYYTVPPPETYTTSTGTHTVKDWNDWAKYVVGFAGVRDEMWARVRTLCEVDIIELQRVAREMQQQQVAAKHPLRCKRKL